MTAKTESLTLEIPDSEVELAREDAVDPACERKHVLFLIDRFPEKMGGAEGALLRTTRLLPARGYRCSVVTFATDPRFGDIRHLFDCPFYVFPLRRTYDANAFRVAIKIIRFIRSQRVDIVHTFFATSDLWGGIIARLSRRRPVLISSRRDMGVERSVKHDLAYRFLGSMFDQVHAVSEQVRLFSIARDHLAPSRVLTLHNGIDLDDIRQIRPLPRSDKTLGLERASHVIIAVGNIRAVKGTDILLRTAAEVCKTFPQAVFAVIGGIHDQQYFHSLERLIDSLGLKQNVKFLGRRHDVIAVLKSCDIYCQCSRSEGLPNSLLEAMACELPCVATAVGGTPEVISDGKDGFLVPSEDPKGTAQRIVTLLNHAVLAREMGEAGHRTVEERFTSEAMVDRLTTYYENVLEAKRVG